jgi:transcriptional regulator with XRE-family HTH domain
MRNKADEEFLRQFGKAVAKRRQSLRLSQEELAERADLSRTYTADVERGNRNLGILNLRRIAKALEIPPGGLLDRLDDWEKNR